MKKMIIFSKYYLATLVLGQSRSILTSDDKNFPFY